MVFHGKISDSGTGQGISGATVKVSYQEYSTGTFSSAYKSLGEIQTSGDGSWSLSFTKPNVVSYRIEVTKADYFSILENINPENVTTDYTKNYTLVPYAFFNVNIKNVNPINAQDKIQFQLTSEGNECSACCNNSLKTMVGETVDTNFYCMKTGDRMVKFQWIVTKSSNTVTFKDSAWCAKGQSVTYNINY